MTPLLFLSGWAAMVAALMVPVTLPVAVAVWRGHQGPPPREIYLGLWWAGYLGVWMAAGLSVWATRDLWPAGAGALLPAGLYQLTPLKHACLRRCRAPLATVQTFYRPGSAAAVWFGVRYAGFCLGCCWALMAAMMLVSAMGSWVLVALATVTVLERLLPARQAHRLGVAAGLAGVLAGVTGLVVRL
ncbi:MAG: DUF2182 domain-containing protein [Armatimonadota bacterium]|nr:DUF2182 domain-containing protein [Armatimonadota bacterium]MDR7485716.1 DUF2182 domain-containing protein [Armatimonadota bacterium]MDR7534167.1 DUF2182 domain-containing protein [Armatimonadota bacterium]MDR7536380.1 DUF2182 domain-containing protein [Armatimonadota bacterium]